MSIFGDTSKIEKCLVLNSFQKSSLNKHMCKCFLFVFTIYLKEEHLKSELYPLISIRFYIFYAILQRYQDQDVKKLNRPFYIFILKISPTVFHSKALKYKKTKGPVLNKNKSRIPSYFVQEPWLQSIHHGQTNNSHHLQGIQQRFCSVFNRLMIA